MSDKQKLRKVLEVAIVTSAADGVDYEEAMSFANSILPAIFTGEAVEEVLTTEAGIDIEDVDFSEITDLIPELIEIVQNAESIELDSNYMKEASSIIGDGIVINNLCMALSIRIANADGISAMEAGALDTVAQGLVNIDPEIVDGILAGLLAVEEAMSES
jgi:hypothetical protein